MQQGIKKLQWLEYLKVVFLEILNPLLCRVFANQVTYTENYTNHTIPPCPVLLSFLTSYIRSCTYVFACMYVYSLVL